MVNPLVLKVRLLLIPQGVYTTLHLNHDEPVFLSVVLFLLNTSIFVQNKFESIPPMNDTTRQILKFERNIKWKQWKCDFKEKELEVSKMEEKVASFVPDRQLDPNKYRELVHHQFSGEA